MRPLHPACPHICAGSTAAAPTVTLREVGNCNDTGLYSLGNSRHCEAAALLLELSDATTDLGGTGPDYPHGCYQGANEKK